MSYPPIFVIVLERTPERTSCVKKQLDALNLNYQLVYGIYKDDLSNAEYRLKLAQQFGMSESDMEYKYTNINDQHGLAVMFSHLQVYDLMIKSKIPVACVLEDDINILPTFPAVLSGALKLSWDILMLSNHSEAGRSLAEIYVDCLRLRLDFFKIFTKLINYHKNYPSLPTMHRTKVAAQCMLDIIKRQLSYCYHCILRRKTTNLTRRPPVSTHYERSLFCEYYSCKMGALAARGKSSRHKVAYNHYMAEPFESLGSGMAYMLTLPTAIKWRDEALVTPLQHIDHIAWKLFLHDEVKVYILSPPCIDAIYSYLHYSIRRPYRRPLISPFGA